MAARSAALRLRTSFALREVGFSVSGLYLASNRAFAFQKLQKMSATVSRPVFLTVEVLNEVKRTAASQRPPPAALCCVSAKKQAPALGPSQPEVPARRNNERTMNEIRSLGCCGGVHRLVRSCRHQARVLVAVVGRGAINCVGSA